MVFSHRHFIALGAPAVHALPRCQSGRQPNHLRSRGVPLLQPPVRAGNSGLPRVQPRDVAEGCNPPHRQHVGRCSQQLSDGHAVHDAGSEDGILHRPETVADFVADLRRHRPCGVDLPYLGAIHSVSQRNRQAVALATRVRTGAVNSIAGFINDPVGMDSERWTGLFTGGAFAWFLVEMRQRFIWWPLHPLGFVAALWGWPIDRYWLSIFLGWLMKVTVLRFGGYRAYRALRPVAFGLILGLSFVMTIWMILHYKWDAPAAIFD